MNRSHVAKLCALAACLITILAASTERGLTSGQNADERLAAEAAAVIQAQCLQCHGEEKMSGLDLRTRDGLLKGGTRGAAVLPGDGAASLLLKFVTGEMQPRMPRGGALSEAEIALLKTWVDRGSPWPAGGELKPLGAGFKGEKQLTDEQRGYWAFKKPVRRDVPQPQQSSWVLNPIDAFVLAAMEKKGLTPSPAADRSTLIRRVTLDLTGLPPTPDEINAFLSDRSPEAYEKVVDRLLSSPRYGERWAQHWLDVARFAETNGFELDQDRPQAWRYRDWVVKAFNEDKPYDRFIIEQIAGDELAPPDAPGAFDLRVATGFMRGGPQHVVAGNQDEALNRQEYLTETMLGVSQAFLGLTVGCARCHDHKFDPIPQADFYRLQAFFAATDNKDVVTASPSEKEAYEAAMKAHKARVKVITDQLDVIEKPYKERIQAEKRKTIEAKYLDALGVPKEKRTEEQKTLAKLAERMLDVKYEELLTVLPADVREKRAALRRQMHALDFEEPTPLPRSVGVADTITPVPAMRILKGGDVHAPTREVPPRFLSVTLEKDAAPAADVTPVEHRDREGVVTRSTGRRLALARWLASPDHPLTARVMANRLWHYHFGRGIVATPNDFGRNGAQPTHPELLDWLATEFVARSWSVKAMHRLMLLSNTYRQSSANDAAKAKLDPDNKLLWRMNRQRLDAEAVRDSVLAAAGTLTEQMAGPSVRVPLEPEVYETIFTEQEPDNLWPVTPDARQHTRRTLYLLRKRNVRLPMLVAFDAPDWMSSCGARAVSVHALQSLTLMNSDFMFAQSRALAERLFRDAGGREPQMIARLYELTLARRPDQAELRATETFLNEQTAIIRGRLAKGEPVTRLNGLPRGVEAARTAAWVDLCLATLNLNEFMYVK
jgi:mono/diheme cytochrome c family protein